MKKIILLASITGLCFASCKKDYTCTCTVPASGSQPEARYTYELKEIKKSSAKSACKIANDNWSLAGGSCELSK
jgi:hypothetical protein